VASTEHGPFMTDEDLELARRNNVVLVGTDFPAMILGEIGLPPEEWHARFVDRLKRAYKISVPMAFGTDVVSDLPGYTRGSLALLFLDSFTEAGVPAKTILQAMTTNAARLLGVEKERGAIQPGLAADIIATPENPLDNIQTLKQVTFVMKDGKVFKRPL
jgi:imidazolonepropionase-like amidohydrolase